MLHGKQPQGMHPYDAALKHSRMQDLKNKWGLEKLNKDFAAKQQRLGHGLASQRRVDKPQHTILTDQVPHLATHRRDDAAAITSRGARVTRILSEHIEHVAEVEADAAHDHLRLLTRWSQHRVALRHHAQATDRAASRKMEAHSLRLWREGSLVQTTNKQESTPRRYLGLARR